MSRNGKRLVEQDQQQARLFLGLALDIDIFSSSSNGIKRVVAGDRHGNENFVILTVLPVIRSGAMATDLTSPASTFSRNDE